MIFCGYKHLRFLIETYRCVTCILIDFLHLLILLRRVWLLTHPTFKGVKAVSLYRTLFFLSIPSASFVVLLLVFQKVCLILDLLIVVLQQISWNLIIFLSIEAWHVGINEVRDVGHCCVLIILLKLLCQKTLGVQVLVSTWSTAVVFSRGEIRLCPRSLLLSTRYRPLICTLFVKFWFLVHSLLFKLWNINMIGYDYIRCGFFMIFHGGHDVLALFIVVIEVLRVLTFPSITVKFHRSL